MSNSDQTNREFPMLQSFNFKYTPVSYNRNISKIDSQTTKRNALTVKMEKLGFDKKGKERKTRCVSLWFRYLTLLKAV